LLPGSGAAVKGYRDMIMSTVRSVSAQPEDAPPAHDDGTPADLRGLIDFLNSRASAKRPERFDTPDHAARFLSLCDLHYDNRPLSAADTRRLRRLRDALVNAIYDQPDSAPWAEVNSITASVPVHLHTAAGPAVGLLAARDNPADVIIVRVLDQVLKATATGRWDRLGACARCQRVFYDNTRSHTRRWCSYATCGNRANVSNYRNRIRST
jgi:predicted RNA-binding Zn ribbon-like protein